MKITQLTLLDLNARFLNRNSVASSIVHNPTPHNKPVHSSPIANQAKDSDSSSMFLNIIAALTIVGLSILCYQAYKLNKDREEAK